MRFKIVCICGSMRFYHIMLQEAVRLTQEEYIVLMPFADKRAIATKDEACNAAREAMLDTMHLVKIDMCSEVLVIDSDSNDHRHIGDSTRREIEYATGQGKRVSYYSLLGC